MSEYFVGKEALQFILNAARGNDFNDFDNCARQYYRYIDLLNLITATMNLFN